jgi:hypothetical protein
MLRQPMHALPELPFRYAPQLPYRFIEPGSLFFTFPARTPKENRINAASG